MFTTMLPRLCAALVACAVCAACTLFAISARAAQAPEPAQAPAPVQAPTPPSALTLQMARAKVIEHNVALRALSYEVAAQDGGVRQAGALPNPELSGLVEDRRSPTRTTTLQLTQTIETGGKRGARIDAAQRGRDLAQAALLAKKIDLLADTSVAFYTLLAAQAQVDLAGQTLALARQSLAAATARVAAGKNSPVDETRSRIAASAAELELAQARGEQDNAREALASLWGETGAELRHATGELDKLPEVGPLPALAERLPLAPSLVSARLELERRSAIGRLEASRRNPDLSITIGSKKDEQLGRRQAVFGVAVPLPLFDRNQGAVQEALQRTEIARTELAAAQLAAASKLRVAHARLMLARSQAAALQRDQLPGAQSALDATRKGYEYGKFTMLDVLDAQRVLLQAKAQQLRVLAAAHAAAADIERILGAAGAVQP